MKLLTSEACLSAADGGNVKRSTVMGDAWADVPSDRGSIPLSSTELDRSYRYVKYPNGRSFFVIKVDFSHDWTMFDPESKKKRHAEVFPDDRKGEERKWN